MIHTCTTHVDVSVSLQVLDMCAAPGSKTAQLIEMIHADDGDSPSATSLPGTLYFYSQHFPLLLLHVACAPCSRICQLSLTHGLVHMYGFMYNVCTCNISQVLSCIFDSCISALKVYLC